MGKGERGALGVELVGHLGEDVRAVVRISLAASTLSCIVRSG